MAKRTAEEERRLFESVGLGRAIATLAVPTIISQMVTVVYNMADTWFIGLANDASQVAALTSAFPIMLAFGAFGNLFGVGGSSLMSRQLGRHENAEAGRTFTFVTYAAAACSVILAVILFALVPGLLDMLGTTSDTYGYAYSYVLFAVILAGLPSILNATLCSLVRSQGNPNQASFGIIIGCILNIALDPVFIVGFGMGVTGAAIATCLSQYIGLTYLLFHVVRKRKVSLAPVSLMPHMIPRTSIAEVAKIGAPATLQVFLSAVSNAVLLALVAGYSMEAVAGLGIMQRLEMLPFAMAMGVSGGVLPLIAYNYASKNHARMRDAIRTSMGAVLALSLTMLALLGIFSTQCVQFFLDDAAAVAYGTDFLRMRLIAVPFIAVDFLLLSVFQALGSARPALVLSVLRKGTVDIPLMFAANALWPLYGVLMVGPVMEVACCAVAVLLYVRLVKRIAIPEMRGVEIQRTASNASW